MTFFFKRKKDSFKDKEVPERVNIYLPHSTERKSRKVKIHQLRVGMYVSELDRPWTDTPFAIQGFYIYNEEDIYEVSKHCDYVYIDVLETKTRGPIGIQEESLLSTQDIHKFPDRNSWTKERQTYDRVTNLTFGLLDKIAMDSGESSIAVRKIIDSCVDSVISNPYALTLISQMERVSEKLENHAISCCALAASFGRFLGMDSKELHELALGALLHDVGMLKLPSSIINCEGKLSPQQYEKVQNHASLGSGVLTTNEYYWTAVDVAYSHHERVDGQGYPRRLKGSSIPYNARIVSIVDVYERLTSSDSYCEVKLSPTGAMGEIYAQKGKQFDAQLVEKFIRFMGVYPLGTFIVLNTGETAIVVEKNPFYMILPKVLIVLDKLGNKIKPKLLDLFAERDKPGNQKITIIRTLSMNNENAEILKDSALNHLQDFN